MVLFLKHSANLKHTQSVSRHCFPTSITPLELATGLDTRVTAIKRAIPPQRPYFLNAKETNSKGKMKKRDDLKRQAEAYRLCSSCKTAESPTETA